jgi:maltose O-acetyltransferase
MENLIIRRATENDEIILSDIAFHAKKHWEYPSAYYEIWKEELAISKSYINENLVYIAEIDGNAVGFYSIVNIAEDFYADEVQVKKGFWLEHVYVLPGNHKKGIGTKLMQNAINCCRENNILKLQIFVEPYSVGFYDKIGADYVGDSKSSIKDRSVPVYEINIVKNE